MLIYIFLFFIVIILIIACFIKIKFQFWSKQPVFQLYNLWYWINPPGIIQHSLPKKNKYINFKDIEFLEFSKVSLPTLNLFIKLIQNHYLPEKKNIYFPEKNNIIPYFTNHIQTPYISLIYDNTLSKNLIGSITSRPLTVFLNNNKFISYYIDYLCVEKSNRKKGIAPQLIQTHEYNQRHQNKTILTCLFKREGNLTMIVPLVVYYVYAFKIKEWKFNFSLPSTITLIKITKENIRILISFLSKIKTKFKCYITTSLGNLLDLINSNNFFIYALVQNHEILSVYFFRKSCMKYNNDEAIECFSTINNCIDKNVFIVGFSLALKQLKNKFTLLLFENLSDSSLVIDNIILKYTPYFVNKSAYYFYNFAITPLKQHEICILN